MHGPVTVWTSKSSREQRDMGYGLTNMPFSAGQRIKKKQKKKIRLERGYIFRETLNLTPILHPTAEVI